MSGEPTVEQLIQAANAAAALAAAEADGPAEAGTEHLLLDLLTDGVAAATLEKLGATRDKIRDASHHLFNYPAGATPSQHTALSAEAQGALGRVRKVPPGLRRLSNARRYSRRCRPGGRRGRAG